MTEIIMLKLGGSLITDKTKPYTVRADVIKRIATEIHDALKEKDIKLIVGHGGGSFPHQSATRYRTQEGMIADNSTKGIALVQNDAAKLNRIVVDALLKKGIDAISIQPSSSTMSVDSRIKSWDIEPIKRFLEHGLVPVPYGDVGLDEKKGCCILSTEEILTYLAKQLSGKRIILAGKTDGVLNDAGKLIPEISKENFADIKEFLGGSDGADATGGMLHKVERMLEFSNTGIQSEIINGNKAGYIKRALLGENGLGTIIK